MFADSPSMVALYEYLGIALGLVGFMAVYLLVGLPLKFAGARRLGKTYGSVFYISAPCYSPTTWDRSPGFSPERIWPAVRALLFWGVHCALAYGVYWYVVKNFEPSPLQRSYLALLPFYVFSETFAAFLRLVFLPAGRVLCPVHARPLLAPSLAKFWGRCWNRWVSDWLRHLIFAPLLRTPHRAAMAVFVVSGLWHEIVLELPHYLAGHQPAFGSMTLFFLVQGLALLIEPKFVRRQPLLRRLYAWVAVVGPSPLLFNEAFLWTFML